MNKFVTALIISLVGCRNHSEERTALVSNSGPLASVVSKSTTMPVPNEEARVLKIYEALVHAGFKGDFTPYELGFLSLQQQPGAKTFKMNLSSFPLMNDDDVTNLPIELGEQDFRDMAEVLNIEIGRSLPTAINGRKYLVGMLIVVEASTEEDLLFLGTNYVRKRHVLAKRDGGTWKYLGNWGIDATYR